MWDRQKLDKLFMGSRGSPARVFMRAVSESPLEASTYGFLSDHVDELDLDVLIAIFGARLAQEVEIEEKPFVRRLAHLVPSANISQLLHVLRVSAEISAEAWIEDLTLPLKGQIPSYQWYRFVDKARGGPMFNALNVGMPRGDNEPSWDPDEMFVTSIEEARAEPIVVGLLDGAHDDIAAANFALKTQPVLVLLHLSAMFPKLLTLEAIKSVLPSRVSSGSQSWAPPKGALPLPDWMAPFVVERLNHCDDAEARVLYDWLFTLPAGTHNGDAYALAVVRFKLAVSGSPEGFRNVEWWTPRVGKHLSKGGGWKTRGRDFVALCIDLGKGFPPATLQAALAAAEDQDGAGAEKHRQSILRKVHDVTATLLIERAEVALKAGDYDKGDLFLSAFTSLDPGLVHQRRRPPPAQASKAPARDRRSYRGLRRTSPERGVA